MKVKFLAVFALAVGVSTVSVRLLAHHGNSAFDTGKRLTLKGTVTEWFWANPHCFLKVDAKNDSGDTAHWVIEAAGTASVANQGWSKAMFKPGDEVVVDLTPYKNQSPTSPLGRFAGRVVINGREFKSAGAVDRPAN